MDSWSLGWYEKGFFFFFFLPPPATPGEKLLPHKINNVQHVYGLDLF